MERIAGVIGATTTADLPDVAVYRNSQVDAGRTGGISVTVAEPDLLDVAGGTLARGRWLDRATDGYPTTVLGATAARRLGVTAPGGEVWLGGRDTTVIGILAPVALVPELDTAALGGLPHPVAELGHTGAPTTRIYERSTDDTVRSVADRIAPTLSPARPSAAAVSRPSDALAARYAADETFTGVLLGLGSIGLVVGGIGVADTMIISVIERRREIGLRRALGDPSPRRGAVPHRGAGAVRSRRGGRGGPRAATTVLVAQADGWLAVVPPVILMVAVGAITAIGALAGFYPAVRATRTPPTTAPAA